MFVCEDCIRKDEVKVLNKSYALLRIAANMGSYGPCEICEKQKMCADV